MTGLLYVAAVLLGALGAGTVLLAVLAGSAATALIGVLAAVTGMLVGAVLRLTDRGWR